MDKTASKQKIVEKKDCKLLIKGLDNEEIDHSKLEMYFRRFGAIERAYIAYCPETGKNKGFGFVIFQKLKDAEKVLEMEFHLIAGVEVSVHRNKLKNEKKVEN